MVGPAEVDRPKPDPAMLHKLLGTLGLGAEEAVYVGDMPIDAETARRAGMPVWLLPTGSATEEEVLAVGPDRFLTSLDGMLEHLPNLSG
jgi:phosphoglycolate phosphatase